MVGDRLTLADICFVAELGLFYSAPEISKSEDWSRFSIRMSMRSFRVQWRSSRDSRNILRSLPTESHTWRRLKKRLSPVVPQNLIRAYGDAKVA